MEFSVPKGPALSATLFWPGRRVPDPPPPFQSDRALDFQLARLAIYHGLRAMRIVPGDRVLVPSFHCGTLVEPVLRSGAAADFYRVRRDCSVDLDDVRARVTGATRALLVVHYFGFPQAIERLQDFCAARRLYLIEDCAHVLVGESRGRSLGSFGDISVFSWRKHLPVCDGGRLIVNNPNLDPRVTWSRPSALARVKAVTDLLEKLGGDPISGLLGAGTRIATWPARAIRRTRSDGASDASHEIDAPAMDGTVSSPAMSAPSRLAWRRFDFGKIVQVRRANHGRLVEGLAAIPGVVPLVEQAPAGSSPWVFPVSALGVAEFHKKLRKEGIPATAWDGVIHPALPRAEFADADHLYHNLAFLPLHQGIGERERERIVEAVARVMHRQGRT